jgi:DNA-binding MarR family transcriptional regulator
MPAKKKGLDRTSVTSGNDRARAARLARERDVLRKLRVVFSSAKKHFRSVEQQCGVSGSQLWALIEIRDKPGLKVSDLADLMTIHLSTASNLLDKLQARALVRRARGDKDQRVVRLYLTQAGARVVANAPKPARGVVPDALSSVPAAALTALENGLNALIARFKITDRRAIAKPLADI